MNQEIVDLYYDPFDFDIDDDPYPVRRRIREEAPLYYNEPRDFYALSRWDDVARELPNWQTYRSGRGTVMDVIKSGLEVPPGVILFEDPPQHDPALIPGAIEEVLRYEAPSPVQARYVAHDTECLGQLIAEGSIMLLINGSANRDEAHFPNGEQFDIHRRGGHLSFGQGLHFCLGSSLARMQARVVLEEFLNRWPEWDVDYAREQGPYRQRAGVVQAADHDTMNATWRVRGEGASFGAAATISPTSARLSD